MMASVSLQNVDPSIRQMAVALVAEGMAFIEAGLLAGGYFYRLRDRFLEQNADEWVRRFGKECADTAARGLCALEEDECLTPAARRTLAKRRKAETRSRLATFDPGRNNWLNRAFLSLFGMRLYFLPLAFLAALAGAGGPAEARGGQEVDARFRALAACGVAKPGPARDKACLPFTSAQRGAYRDWDGPRGPAPRPYELPREWEVDPYR